MKKWAKDKKKKKKKGQRCLQKRKLEKLMSL